MKNLILSVIVVGCVLTNSVYVEARSQETQPPAKQSAEKPDEETGKVEIMSISVVDSVDGIQRDVWKPADSSANKGLVVRVRVERGFGYSTEDFALEYKSRGKNQKAKCVGVTARLPDGWVFNEHAAVWKFYPGGQGTLDGLGILFLLPNDVSEARLLYKDKPSGDVSPINRTQ